MLLLEEVRALLLFEWDQRRRSEGVQHSTKVEPYHFQHTRAGSFRGGNTSAAMSDGRFACEVGNAVIIDGIVRFRKFIPVLVHRKHALLHMRRRCRRGWGSRTSQDR